MGKEKGPENYVKLLPYERILSERQQYYFWLACIFFKAFLERLPCRTLQYSWRLVKMVPSDSWWNDVPGDWGAWYAVRGIVAVGEWLFPHIGWSVYYVLSIWLGTVVRTSLMTLWAGDVAHCLLYPHFSFLKNSLFWQLLLPGGIVLNCSLLGFSGLDQGRLLTKSRHSIGGSTLVTLGFGSKSQGFVVIISPMGKVELRDLEWRLKQKGAEENRLGEEWMAGCLRLCGCCWYEEAESVHVNTER